MSAAKKTHWLRNTLAVLVACGLLGIIIGAAQFFGNPDPAVASASLELSFDGAVSGLAPDGSRFDVNDLTGDEVLTEALTASGLNDKYTPAQIRSALRVDGVVPADIVNQLTSYESVLDFNASRTLTISEYHPTLYTVILKGDFDRSLSQKDLSTLLENILSSFKARFLQVYAMGTPSLNVNWNLDDYDYPQKLTIVSRLMQQGAAYARQMYAKDPLLKVNGSGFNDIAVRLDALVENDISRLNAEIVMNALSTKPERLITQYQFNLQELNIDLNKKQDQLEQMDALIASYKKNEVVYLATADAVTKIDGNSGATYDELIARRKTVTDEIADLNGRIALITMRLNDLLGLNTSAKAETPEVPATRSAETENADAEEKTSEAPAVQEMSEAEIAAAAEAAQEAAARKTAVLESGISDLLSRREAIMTDFAALLKAYNDQKLNDLTVAVSDVKVTAPRLLSGAFVMKCVKTAGPLCALGFIACMIALIISRVKEDKAKKA